MTEVENDSSLLEGNLQSILENPVDRILPLLYQSKHSKDQEAKQKTRAELLQAAKHIFQGIEETAKLYHQTTNGKSEGGEAEDEQLPLLSGLSELYIPSDGSEPVDAETIWGQVELQNNALNKLLKKSTKKLGKSPKDIVVLDMNQLSSDEGEDDSETEDEDGDEDAMGSEAEREDDGDEQDEEARRIQERMERAMEDVDAESDEESHEKPTEESGNQASQEKKEELYDPVVEEMKDGFFDLNDMEEYADEEEDYLPQDTFGESEAEKNKKAKDKKKKTFHQMQRDGDLLNHSDDEDDENDFEELYEEEFSGVKRKKYREDEDIDALYSLYQAGKNDGSDAEDAANMTAADFFGQPSKRYMERYNAKKAKEEVKGDDDSWGEYDFEQDAENDDDNESAGDSDDEQEEGNENEDHGKEELDDEADDKKEETKASKVSHSKCAKQSEKLRKQTEQLERELLAKKPWQMTGETKGTSRPVNSLLEGTPEFEMASKQAPTITIEHTTNLEDVIKKRILAEDWDDVVPRELPDVGWHKKQGELPEVSQEKSKLGLGELYEREYLKKAVGYDKDAEEKKTEEDKAKDEMKQLFANLCSKLDGLSNYHFAPRPIAEEAEVRTSSTPAIAMEEVLPLHVSDSRGVAPEEVYGTKRGREGILRGETEMDQQERKRLRQSKKAARRKARKEKQADERLISRLEPGLGLNNPYEKRKMREELAMARAKGKVSTGEQDMDGKYGSSGTFFKRLQNEAKQTISGHGDDQEQRQKKSRPKTSALKS